MMVCGRIFPDFESLEISQRNEIIKGMNQYESGILLRNWMEVRKIFLHFIFESEDSPYHPTDAMFSRDEYQSDVGNLPHMHMMVSVNTTNIISFFCL